MTNNEAKTLKLPAECWTTGSTPSDASTDDVWMPIPVTVLEYSACREDTTYPSLSLLCRDGCGEFRTSVDLVFSTKVEAEADVTDVLRESYEMLDKSIPDATPEMSKLKLHPLWKDSP